jgi:pimeloyl-ACP methyl ester carboxylesterase
VGKLLLVLLPGLDGTGDLFRPLLDVLPPAIDYTVVSYPTDCPLSYDELMPMVAEQVPHDRPLVLLAESFSGPLALRYAAAHPDRVRALVLCASFMRSPVPAWTRFFVRSMLFRLPPPTFALRMLLVGWRTPASLVSGVRTAIRRVRPNVMAHRVREVLALDCSDALAACTAPILYLRATHDAIVKAKSLRTMAASKPDVTAKVVQGPHLLLQASPADAWTEIAEFLSGLSSGPIACQS